MTETQSKSREAASEQPAARAGSTLGGRLSGRLGSLMQRSGVLVDRLAGSVKEVARSGLLRQALDARERGNLPAAFHLLDEDHRKRPDDADVAAVFWDVAVEYGRSERAVDAVASLIRKHANGGAIELAAQYWIELSTLQPDALVDAATLTRVVSHVHAELRAEPAGEAADDTADDAAASEREKRRQSLLRGLRAIVDERNSGLTPGLALHTAELARELDPDTVLAAARFALASGQLHEAKRARLEATVAELDPNAPRPTPSPALEAPANEAAADAPAPAAAGEPASSEAHPARNHPLRAPSPPQPALSEAELAAMQARLPPSRPTPPPPPATPAAETAPAGRAAMEPSAEPADGTPLDVESDSPCFGGLKVMAGEPIALEQDALTIVVAGGRRTRIDYAKIEAMAVAEVWGLAEAPVVLIDLVLNWREQQEGPLRVVRLRSDGFDPCALMPEESERGQALQALLASLLERSAAIPLPDPDSALGLVLPVFESLADYERGVLQIGT